jgi:hypothetical protein
MKRRWIDFLNLLRLLRPEVVGSALSNAWLMVFLARSVESAELANPALLDMSLPAALLVSGIVAVGLAVYGLALNDIVDAERDKSLGINRPIAAGAISHKTGVFLAVFGLVASLCASVWLGKVSVLVAGSAAVLVLFYDLAGKFLPALGIVTLGLIRILNMLTPNPNIDFGWPIWLTMTHVIALVTLAYVLEGKRPRLTGTHFWGICLGWSFWSMVLIGWMRWRDPQSVWHTGPSVGHAWVLPALATAGFFVAGWWVLRQRMRPLPLRRNAGGQLIRLGTLWLVVYDASWLLALGLYKQALIITGIFFGVIFIHYLLSTLVGLSTARPTFKIRA